MITQTITGTFYDAETTVKGVKIFNETENKVDFTDADGNFNIEAAVGEQLLILSHFHEKLKVTVKASDFLDPVVLELKKITNALEEVQLMNVFEKKFDSVQVNTEINIQLANDLKNRPYLYQPMPSGNLDLV